MKFENKGKDMENKENVGLTIIVTDKLESGDGLSGDGFIKAKTNTGEFATIHQAILECLNEEYTIEVEAFSLQNAIERILYSIGAMDKFYRQFFLSQISHVLIEVQNKWSNIDYKVDTTIRELILEDKMYRIMEHEETLKKA